MAQVVIHNKLPQAIMVSILSEDVVVELKLEAHAKSAELPESAITPHARQLASSGFIKIRPV